MLTLAVTTQSTTFERMQAPFRDRGIDPVSVAVEGRSIPIGEEGPWEPDGYDVGYVFPSRLMEGGVFDALLELPWVNDRDAVLRSRNKAEVLAIADRVGLPIPKTTLVSNPVSEATLRDVWAAFEGPVIVKPNSTTRGVGVARAADLDSFLGLVDYLELVHDFRATGDKSYLVQAFLPEARDVRVMVIDGEYVGAVEREVPASDEQDRWKHNVHRGARATRVTPEPAVRSLAEDVAAAVDIPFAGVDLLVTAEGPVVSETNARPTIDRAEKYEPGFWDRLAETIRRRA